MKPSEPKSLKSMTFDELTSHIQELFTEAHALKRQAALTIVKAGEALSLAREKLPEGLTWVKYQAELGLPRATVNEAVRLHKAAKQAGLSDKELASLGVMDAKYRLGVRLRDVREDVIPVSFNKPRYVLSAPTKRNALKVMDRSISVLEEAVSLVESGQVEFDKKRRVQLKKLIERVAQLEESIKPQPTNA